MISGKLLTVLLFHSITPLLRRRLCVYSLILKGVVSHWYWRTLRGGKKKHRLSFIWDRFCIHRRGPYLNVPLILPVREQHNFMAFGEKQLQICESTPRGEVGDERRWGDILGIHCVFTGGGSTAASQTRCLSFPFSDQLALFAECVRLAEPVTGREPKLTEGSVYLCAIYVIYRAWMANEVEQHGEASVLSGSACVSSFSIWLIVFKGSWLRLGA